MSLFQLAGLWAGFAPSFLAPDAAAAPGPVRALLRRVGAGRGAKALEMDFCCRARLALARREWVLLSRVRRQMLVCEAGELWVTLDGDTEDHLLRPGERLAIAANAAVIVTATRDALLRVDAGAPALSPRCARPAPASGPARGAAPGAPAGPRC